LPMYSSIFFGLFPTASITVASDINLGIFSPYLFFENFQFICLVE